MKTIEERVNDTIAAYKYLEYDRCGVERAKEMMLQVAYDQHKIDCERAKEAFEKAVGWCRTYRWYQGVCDEFIKALEGEE